MKFTEEKFERAFTELLVQEVSLRDFREEIRFPVDTRSVIPVIPVHSGCDIFDTVVQS